MESLLSLQTPIPSAPNGKSHKIFHFTDAGNGERMAYYFGDKIRYDRKRGIWLVWNGTIWQPELDNGLVKHFAKETARLIQQEAISMEYGPEKEAIMSWGIKCESRQRIENTLALAQTEKPIADNGENWDKNEYLFACINGIIDLKTGEIREGKQGDRITRSSPITYNREAKRERWEKFIDEVFEGNYDLIHYVHKALGYSLTGNLNEQAVFIGIGRGGNGKSKMFDAIRYVMGTYAREAEPLTFYRMFNRNNDFDLPALEGVRMIVVAENSEGSALDLQRVKRFSGGDPVTAAAKHKNATTYIPSGKLWMYFNHRPVVNDDTISIWDRLKCIPYNAEFRGSDSEDKNLAAKLREEGEGILAWLVEGCLMWQEEGLTPLPDIMKNEVDDYQKSSDPLTDFIDEGLILNQEARTSNQATYGAYDRWADRNGLRGKAKLNATHFGIKMHTKFESYRSGNEKGYIGFSLRLEQENMSWE